MKLNSLYQFLDGKPNSMPYRSLAQMKYMHSQQPKIAKQWDTDQKESLGPDSFKDLPEHVKPESDKKNKKPTFPSISSMLGSYTNK